MLLWMDEITNRTQSDVDRLLYLTQKDYKSLTTEERLELTTDSIGAFNYSDVIRLENNIQLLSDVLDLDLTTYLNNLPDYPNYTYIQNLLGNVSKIRESYTLHADTPLVPKGIATFKDVNDIEKILGDIHTILLSNFESYCSDDAEIYIDEMSVLL